MPTFVYRAVTENGAIVRNRVEDINRKNLIRKLKNNNLMPINIVQVDRVVISKKQKQKRNINSAETVVDESLFINNEKRSKKSLLKRLGINITKKITTRDIVIFTQDLYLLKKANFNNIHALSTIIGTTENDTLREIIKDILAGVEAGENMYTTMEYYSDVFPYLYINMIRVGEESGSLTKSLEEAVQYLDENEKFTKKVRGIIVPNVLMLVAIVALLIVGVVFIIPVIQNLYESMGSDAELPPISIWFSNFLDFLVEIWYIPVAIIGGIVAFIIYYINTPKGRYNFDYFKYTMPLFGKLIFSLDFLRFSRAMLLNLNNGIRIQDSLETSKNLIKNYVLRSIIESSINDIIVGQSWVESFEKSGLASPMIIEMLNIGMSTDLKEMMGKLLEYLQIDIDNTLAKIMKVLPEIVYLIVGVALIFLVLVVLVPAIEVYMGGWIFSAAGL